MGQKIEWMRLNPLVCVEIDEIPSDVDWTSMVVRGRYEELPEKPEYYSKDAKAGASLAGKEVHVVAKRSCRSSDS
jgi:nitroimidazol reductase NimA-like FMN-containing flavoprotein (pyridoxamine 5'-phosphate oxidase superfamily)